MTLLAACVLVGLIAHGFVSSPKLTTTMDGLPTLVVAVVLVLALTALFDLLLPVIT